MSCDYLPHALVRSRDCAMTLTAVELIPALFLSDTMIFLIVFLVLSTTKALSVVNKRKVATAQTDQYVNIDTKSCVNRDSFDCEVNEQSSPNTGTLSWHLYLTSPTMWKNRMLSRWFQPLTTIEIPTQIRYYLYSLYGWWYDVQWQDFRTNISEYPSINAFFTRKLKKQRQMNKSILVSPVDGTVVSLGTVEDLTTDDESEPTLEQIKGVPYKLKQFLGEFPNVSEHYVNNQTKLNYIIIYLSPGDYHRFHAGCNFSVSTVRHIPGDLYPVKPSWLKTLPGLFALNERVVLSGTWMSKLYNNITKTVEKTAMYFSYVPVGAFNVGSIKLNFRTKISTNQPNQDNHKSRQISQSRSNKKFEKGDEVGHFEFGSTVALVFETSKHFMFSVEAGNKVRFGSAIGDIVNDDVNVSSL